MNEELMMLEAALQQLVQLVVEKYDGPRDRAAIHAYADTFWREKVRPSLPELVEQLELGEELDEDALDSTQDGFCASIVERLRDRGPRGSHTPVTLGWTAIGPRPASAGFVPPKAVHICDYILAYDDAARAFIYAYGHDYHQFGRAFALGDDGTFRPFSKNAFRLGSAQQYWTGAYDPQRGGVVGFSVDRDTVVGVVVREEGLAVLASAAYFEDNPLDEDEPSNEERIVLGGDVPTLEGGEWSDLLGVFGYDRARATWVLLSEAGIWELGPDNTWTKRAELVPAGVVPKDVEGNREHSGGGAGGVWDGKRRQVVFWFVDTKRETLQLSAWDATASKLIELPSAGLPDELAPRFGLGTVVAEHPTHGVVLYAGAKAGLFTLGGDGAWTAIPVDTGAPPKSRAANLAFGPDDTALQGPGQYALDPDADEDDSGEDQGVFFVRRGGSWSRLGTVAAKSPLEGIKSSGGRAVLVAAGGGVFATAWRRSLETLAWTDATGFVPRVSAEDGEAAFAEATPEGKVRAALFEASEKKLHALSDRGAVYRLDDEGWSVVANGSEAFARTGFGAAFDESNGRIVVWGGEKGKGDNDTWLFADGQWRKTEASPRPRDLRYRFDEHGFDVDIALVYDRTLGRVLRVGYDELAVLVGDSWRTLQPESLRDFVTPSHRLVAHDPRTGETLCVCPQNGNVVRIDLAGCDLVGTIAAPTKADLEDDDEAEPLKLPFRDLVFDPETRRILTFSAEDLYGSHALDLGPAFDLARTLAPRVTELPAAPPPTVRLYRAENDRISAFYADEREGSIVVRTGVLGQELSSETMPAKDAELARLGTDRRAAGWVTADALEPEALAAALGRPAWGIGLDKSDDDDDEDEDDEEDSHDVDAAATSANRLGGLPSALAHGDWPKDKRGNRLGFLLQIELPPELGDGGLAVFVKTDGTATEGEENNVVLRRTREQLAEPPPRKAPKGVPVLRPRALTIGKRTSDIEPGLVDKLGAEDPLLANAIEAAQPGTVPFDKLGGQPRWLQGAESDAPLLLQLDFDDISIEEPWEDAGLHGAIYVFKSKRGAVAMWQYT